MNKKSTYTQYLEWIVMLVLFFGIVYFSKEWGFIDNLKPETKAGKIIMTFGIFIMAFIVLGVHELGHLLTGLASGFRFEMYVVGPLGVRREGNKVKFYLNTNLGYYGGIAGTSPREDNDQNAKKFAHILLAGPIASVLFAILCIGAAQFIGKPFGIIVYTGGLISIAIFFATTIPSRSGIFFTDRKRYQRLMTPGKDQDIELAMLRIMGRFGQDGSYKNVSQEDIDLMVSDDLPFIRYIGLFNKICYQLEMTGEIESETSSEYTELSKSMSKQLVKAFDLEIGKYKEKVKSESEEE